MLCLETIYICCAAATPVSGTRVASGLRPGTPKGAKVFGGIKHKAKVSVLIMSLYRCATEGKFPAERHAGFKDHNLCFAEVDCELALFTEFFEVGQCIQLLEFFWASGHQNEVINIQQQWG